MREIKITKDGTIKTKSLEGKLIERPKNMTVIYLLLEIIDQLEILIDEIRNKNG